MKALIIQNNQVINTVLLPDNWTGKAGEWKPDKNTTVLTSDVGGVGDTIVNGKLTPATPLPVLKDDVTILREALIAKGVINATDISAVAVVAAQEVLAP